MSMPEICVLCGADYTAKRLGSMYCRPACKHRAMRQRHAAAQELTAARAAQVESLLVRQTHALATGADPAVLSALSREATALLGR